MTVPLKILDWGSSSHMLAGMKKIPEVEYARALMTEAQDWSLWRWLFDKSKVRKAADDCNAALAAAEEKVRAAFDKSGKKRNAAVKRVLEALDEAERVRLDAEDIFDEADRRLSTSMACDGAKRAIEAWTMREEALKKAQEVLRDPE